MRGRKPFKVKIISKRRSRSLDSNRSRNRHTSMSPYTIPRYGRQSYSRSTRRDSLSYSRSHCRSRSPSIQRGRSSTRRDIRNNRNSGNTDIPLG
jgi:hypothetical protein